MHVQQQRPRVTCFAAPLAGVALVVYHAVVHELPLGRQQRGVYEARPVGERPHIRSDQTLASRIQQVTER